MTDEESTVRVSQASGMVSVQADCSCGKRWLVGAQRRNDRSNHELEVNARLLPASVIAEAVRRNTGGSLPALDFA